MTVDRHHPRANRLALVLVAGRPKGSGYLMDSGHVLTARHVVGEVGNRVGVRMCQEQDLRPARVVWRGDEIADVALLALDDEVREDRGPDPEWASCGRSDRECGALGYPKFQDETEGSSTKNAQPETERFRGRLEPDAGLEYGRLNLRNEAGPRKADTWGGMCGAAVFMENLLVGVVTEALDDRLLAWPVDRLADERALVDAWGGTTHSVITDALWPREDQPLLRALGSWEVRTPKSRRPAVLLNAAYEVVPFEEEGRRAELELLEHFVEGSERDGVQVIVGPGGAGKTRLMIEWCRRMRAKGWIAGFVRQNVSESEVRGLVAGSTPRLVVLDYVATDPKTAAELLRSMVERNRQGAPRMRVVLLARNVGPWFGYLRDDDTRIADLLDEEQEHPLPDLYGDRAVHERGFAIARSRFAERDGDVNAGANVRPRALDASVANRALYLHMQALLAVYEGSTPEREALGDREVLEQILVHESKFWRTTFEDRSGGASFSGQTKNGLEQAAALLVFCGAVPSQADAAAWFAIAAPDLLESRRELVVESLGHLYPGGEGGGGLAPIEPDLLGEELLARVIDRDAKKDGGLQRWLDLPFREDAPAGAIARALTVLTRLAQRSVGTSWLVEFLRAHGGDLVERVARTANEKKPDPQGSVLAEALEFIDDPDVAELIGGRVPEQTVELREVQQIAYGVARELLRARGDEDLEHTARVLNNYGRALGNVGRREEALEATQEAVDLRRRLAKERPDAFLPNLAGALNNLGIRLEGLGRREEALAATQEAVDLRRRLAKERPDAFLPDLAMALGARGQVLRGLARRPEAMQLFTEALQLILPMARQLPGAFGGLANALANDLRKTAAEADRPIPADIQRILDELSDNPAAPS